MSYITWCTHVFRDLLEISATMMLWLAALGLLHSCTALVKSKPQDVVQPWDDLIEKHSWVDVPQGWDFEAPAPQDYIFDLRIGLKPTGMDDLIANLMEISDPAHDRYILQHHSHPFQRLIRPRYSQHLFRTEVASFLAPHPSSAEAIESWLAFHKIDRTNIGRVGGGNEWVTLRISVAEAERLLGAKYSIYHNPASHQRIIRTLTYSLPRELHQHIDVVAPTTYFGTFQSMRVTHFLQPLKHLAADPVGVPLGSCQTAITPACLRALYNTEDYVPVSTSKNKIGVTGYLGEFASTSDLQVSIALSSNGIRSNGDS